MDGFENYERDFTRIPSDSFLPRGFPVHCTLDGQVKQIEEFCLVAKFMLNILALPNSNAECERMFSQINDTKTKKRNKLITNTIRGNMLAKQAISRQTVSCVSFEPTEAMLKLFNSGIYNKERAIGLNDSDSD